MTADQWRCFVAVPLSDELRGALVSAVERWRADPATDGLRWVEPANLHLTLAFLGGRDPAEVPSIEARLRSLATGHRPRIASTGRLGAFHRTGTVRVLWYGVQDSDGALASLAGELAAALDVPAEAPFQPHVTLARARRRPADLRGWMEPASLEAPGGRLDLKEMLLMRSGPARYETLASIPLSGAPA